MVLGLNGRLPLNTVGNLQARANADTTNNTNAVCSHQADDHSAAGHHGAGLHSRASMSTFNPALYYKQLSSTATTQLLLPPTAVVSSQTYLDAPLWDHASHLGYSVNEINPKFALQNAPSNVYLSPTSLEHPSTIGPNVNGTNYSQVDDAGRERRPDPDAKHPGRDDPDRPAVSVPERLSDHPDQ